MVRPVTGSGGNSSRVASQPRCCNTPRKGGDVTALPTTFTRAGSVPASMVTALPSAASRTGASAAYLSRV